MTRIGDVGRWPANILIDEDVAYDLGPERSKYFYCPKASKAEREAGLDDLDVRPAGGLSGRRDGSLGGEPVQRRNHHPTVKPAALMRWLIRLVAPANGIICDPFMGSGSTGVAAILENCRFIGIDLNPDYVEIAQARIAHALKAREAIRLAC